MSRGAKIAVGVLGALAGIGVLALAALLVLTQTDWGREHVRRIVVEQLDRAADGTVTIGALEGDLLTGIRLIDVSIVDAQGRPFVQADTVFTRYALRSLIRQRIHLTDMRLVRPVIVLDQPPGEEWNVVRIFPRDAAAPAAERPGWGDWLRLDDLTLVDGRVTIRSEWEVPDTLPPAARDSAIAAALAGDDRANIVRVPGGFQNVMDFRQLHAVLPRVLVAHPDSAGMHFEIADLRGIVQPFRPPAAEVRALSGNVALAEDSLFFRGIQAVLPGSRVAAEGVYSLDAGDLLLRLRGAPAALADFRWLYPHLPEEGGGPITLVYHQQGPETSIVADDADLRVRDSRLTGQIGLLLGDTVRLHDTDLRFTALDTRLIEQVVPDLEVPRHGRLDGRLVLAGTPRALEVDADVAFAEPRSGTSRVLARGGVTTGEVIGFHDLHVRLAPLQSDLLREVMPELPPGGRFTGRATLDGATRGLLRVAGDLAYADARTGVSRVVADGGVVLGEGIGFREFRLRLDPFQVALARTLVPDLPLDGQLTGTAMLNGSTAARLAARADLVHRSAAERSRVVGSGSFELVGARRVDLDLRLLPLSLVTVGRFAPAAGLRGAATGDLELRGALRDLVLRADLRLPDGGSLAARGRFDLESERPAYDVNTRLLLFNAAAVTTHAPATSLSGVAAAQGRGFDPATMDATLAADFSRLRVDTVGLDTAHVRLAVADGLATVGAALLRTPFAEAEASGSLGLVAGRHGELAYRVEVDSLGGLAPWLPSDTGTVAPRPGSQAHALARAREDSARIARATEVERAATGAPEPALQVDTVRPLRRDSIAGWIHAAGTLRGNLEALDLAGSAELRDVVFRGDAVRYGRAEYAWLRAGTAAPRIELDAAFDSIRAAGFALDSATARVRMQGEPGSGNARLAIYQDERHDYRLDADFTLATERSELQLNALELRFDTTYWESTRPAVVAWGAPGIEIETLELREAAGGRIYLDGRLPVDAAADLELAVERLQLADVVALLQDDAEATGLLSLSANLQGTRQSPRLQGELDVVAASYQQRPLPDARATFRYADTSLEAGAELLQGARTLVTAEATLPVDLALAGVPGPRFLDQPLEIDLRADSLPLDALPSFTDAIQELEGRVIGNVAVRGTRDNPTLGGQLDVDLGAFRAAATGVRYRDIVGTLRLQDDRIVIDSLVGRAAGTVRVEGTLDVATLARPGFELRLNADDAYLFDTDRGRVRADADLAMQGPFDAARITGTVRTRGNTVVYLPESGRSRVISLDDPDILEMVDTTQLAERGLLPVRSELAENLQVDVELHIERDTWVRSMDANVEIYTPEDTEGVQVHLNQAAGALTLEGVLNTDRGEYSVMGRRFQVTRGSAQFIGVPEIDPLLQITAEHEVRLPGREALQIRVLIGGTMLAPTLALESDAQPPVSQSDLLSYLAFGRSAGSLLQQQGSGLSGQGAGSGALVGDVAAVATRQLTAVALNVLVDEFESNMARSLGLDVFHITPADLPAEVWTAGLESLLRGTEVEGGVYLNTRTFIAAQARPTRAQPGIRVEYRTPGGFRWVTTWEPYFLPTEPSLSQPQDAVTTSTFGAFLIREWRF